MQRDQPFEPVSSPSNDQYDFTVDWFSQQSGSWAGLLSWIAPKRILEIGSYEGRSTTFLIESCSSNHPIEIVCIDTWEGSFEHAKGAFTGAAGARAEKSELDVQAKAQDRHRAAIGVVGGIGDELVIQRHLGSGKQRSAVIDLRHCLVVIMYQAAVTDQGA